MGKPSSCTRLRIQITCLAVLLAAIYSASNVLSTVVLIRREHYEIGFVPRNIMLPYVDFRGVFAACKVGVTLRVNYAGRLGVEEAMVDGCLDVSSNLQQGTPVLYGGVLHMAGHLSCDVREVWTR